MNILTLILLSFGLAMDALTVSLANGMVYKDFTKKDAFLSSLAFGLFQGLMPLLGFFLGQTFSSYIEHFTPYIAFGLLTFLGVKMIIESFKHQDNLENISKYTYKTMLIQAIATSIDAFAIGITFAFMGTNIWLSCGIIAIITFICCIIACIFGKKLGKLLNNKAELIGGVILILIGVKIFVEYLIKIL